MRETDLNTLMHFITRTGMYIGKVTDDSVISFIHGYEIGTEGKCDLTSSISQLLSSRYGIKKMATGWPGQIREYGVKNNISWVTSFRKISLKYFYETQDFNKDSEFKNSLKSGIESKIGQLNLEWVASNFANWHDEWKGFVDVREENFRIIWSEKELKVICDLNDEIDKISFKGIHLTDKLLELRLEYKNKTKTQQNI